jgi:hypothetical protein
MLKGFGISFIDNSPKPIIYIRAKDIRIKYITINKESDDKTSVEETKLTL